MPPPRPATMPRVKGIKPIPKTKPATLQSLKITSKHISTFESAIKAISDDAQKVLEESNGYDHVSAFISYWEESDHARIRESAVELAEVFRSQDKFGYKTICCPIPDRDAESFFAMKLSTAVHELNSYQADTSKKLFIFYYGGHADNVDGYGGRWYPLKSFMDCKPVRWNKIRYALGLVKCDILIIFDCCHALDILDDEFDWPRRCELLAAAGVVEGASASSNNFTRAITEYLKSQFAQSRSPADNAGGTVSELYRRITRGEHMRAFGMITTPHLLPLTKNARLRESILLRPMGYRHRQRPVSDAPSDVLKGAMDHRKLQGMTEDTEARVVMVLRFNDATNPASKPIKEEWLEWMRLRPSGIDGIELCLKSRAGLEMLGLFDADSKLAIVSVPIWLWQTMPQDDTMQYVGIVRSTNLLKGTELASIQALQDSQWREQPNPALNPPIFEEPPTQSKPSPVSPTHMRCPGCFRRLPPEVATKGRVTKRYGLDTYVIEPPNGSPPKGIIVIIPDLLGWRLPSHRILADYFAAEGNCRVYLPDFMNGYAAPVSVRRNMQVAFAPCNPVIRIYAFLLAAIEAVPFSVFNILGRTYPRVKSFFEHVRQEEGQTLPIGAAGLGGGGQHLIKLAQGVEIDGQPLIDVGFVGDPGMLEMTEDILKIKRPLSFACATNRYLFTDQQAKRIQAVVTTFPDEYRGELEVYEETHYGFLSCADTTMSDGAVPLDVELQAIAWFRSHF